MIGFGENGVSFELMICLILCCCIILGKGDSFYLRGGIVMWIIYLIGEVNRYVDREMEREGE